jgi:hypothetical protein
MPQRAWFNPPVVEHKAAIHLVFDDSLAGPQPSPRGKDPRIPFPFSLRSTTETQLASTAIEILALRASAVNRSRRAARPVVQPKSEFRRTEIPGWRLARATTQQPLRRRQPCRHCVALARRRTISCHRPLTVSKPHSKSASPSGRQPAGHPFSRQYAGNP